MTYQPLITVIVPVYNVKESIHQCIDSVLKQTYTNFELLLVDDGATDGSGNICEDYATQDIRIRCFHKQNGGVSSARNLGLDNARGELITFLDSDDYFDPDMLEYLYGLIESTGVNYSKCPARLVGWPLSESKEYPESDYQIYSEEEAIKNTLVGRLGFTGSSCHNLYKKSIIEHVRFCVSRSNEDLDFITRVTLHGGDVVVTKCPKYNYVYHADGGHATPLRQFIQELNTVYARLHAILEEEKPEMLPYLDVRYVRNAIDMLNTEVLTNRDIDSADIQNVRRLILEKQIDTKWLIKKEKLWYKSLSLGRRWFVFSAKLLNMYLRMKTKEGQL